MSNDVSTLEHVYQHEGAVAAALAHNPFVGAPGTPAIDGLSAAHGQSNVINESKMGTNLDKAVTSLPGHPTKDMSHAGVAPGGKVRLTGYVSDRQFAFPYLLILCNRLTPGALIYLFSLTAFDCQCSASRRGKWKL